MFQDPSSSSGTDYTFKPGKYLGLLKRLEDGGEGQYGPRIKWVWNLFNTGKDASDVIPMYDSDGEYYEFFQRTSTKFGKNPKTGKVAKAREWAEALLNRPISDDEKGKDIAAMIPGKRAVLHVVASLGSDGQTTYMDIKFVEPYTKGALAPIIREPEDAFGDDDEDDTSDTPALAEATPFG